MTSYLVEFLILRPVTSPSGFRAWIAKRTPWARELLVVGDGDVIRAHLRTDRPDLALAAGLECGTVQDVVVELETAAVGAAELAPSGS